jgi:hypothetical protein
MKKSILLFGALVFATSVTFAQNKKENKKSEPATPAAAQKLPAEIKPAPGNQPAATPTQSADGKMKFNQDEHNFGNIPEGPAVSFDFEFENTGSEAIVLSGVQASCGCTTPTWTKDPVKPKGKGKITATYNTQGRPGNFVKTITVNSNVGTKVIKITGNVEKAPDASVPANNGSIMKH